MIDCKRFHERFQRRVDRGQSLRADRLLRQHASACLDCRNDLHAWQQISESIERPTAGGYSSYRLAAAAVVLLAGIAYYTAPGGRSQIAQRPTAPPAAAPAPLTDAGDAVAGNLWPENWTEAVAQPLVPIGEGVRPLARGFRSALGLLIIPGHPSAPAADSSSSPVQAIVPCLSNFDAYA